MPVAKLKKGEKFESLLRRFTTGVKGSGRLRQRKKIKVHTKPLNKRKRKQKALRALDIASYHEYLKKIGRLKDDNTFVKVKVPKRNY